MQARETLAKRAGKWRNRELGQRRRAELAGQYSSAEATSDASTFKLVEGWVRGTGASMRFAADGAAAYPGWEMVGSSGPRLSTRSRARLAQTSTYTGALQPHGS